MSTRLKRFAQTAQNFSNEHQATADGAHKGSYDVGDSLHISEDGRNGSVTFEAKGLNREKKKFTGKTDREFIPYTSINHVAQDRRIIGRDQVTITISGKSFGWKVARDAEGFVNTLNLIAAGAHPTLGESAGQTQPTPSQPQPQPVDVADQLSKLASLRDQGVLTDGEFAAQKATLLQ